MEGMDAGFEDGEDWKSKSKNSQLEKTKVKSSNKVIVNLFDILIFFISTSIITQEGEWENKNMVLIIFLCKTLPQ